MKVKEWFESQIQKISDSIENPISVIHDWFEEKLSQKLQESLEGFFESYEDEIREYVDEPLTEILKNESLPVEIRKLLEEIRTPKKFAIAPLLLAAVAVMAIPAISAAGAGAMEQIRQESFKYSKPSLLGVSDSIAAYWRNLISKDQFRDELHQNGYSDERIEILEEISKYIPNAPDLIRFAVRDVFDEEVVRKYGYDSGFEAATSAIGDRLRQAGMDEETLRLFWRAHWELPSIQLGFEMLHRGKITEEELKKLLQIADIAPNFIQPIMDISYSPYTRVDVRRMYEAGVLSRDEVKRTYLDLGYDEEHAENLTVWTVQESVATERDLTKSEILKSYSLGRIQRSEALDALQDLGYDADEADIILSLLEYQEYEKSVDRQKKLYADMYYHSIISKEEFMQELDGLGLSEREKSLLIAETDVRKQGKHRNPTKTDLEKWYKAGHISQQEFRDEMRNLGYKDKYIELYMKS